MAFFEIKDLTFTYPGREVPQLSDICLEIRQGEYITLCGKSGSGKTTLLKHLKPVLSPAGECTGEILMDGMPVDSYDLRTQAGTVGYVMQNTDDQIVTDKVWHELAFGLENLGVNQKTIRTRTAEMASYFGIQNWFNKDTALLSGGQKQLLNLASIMAMQPQVLILDEPTSQLDPIAASDFLNTVRKINLELGTTVIITEHRLEDIYPYSDRVIFMDEGKILCDGTPLEVAEELHRSGNDMFAAMPSPVRIFYEAGFTGEDCPLTVREGRTWLSRICTVSEAAQAKPDPDVPVAVPAVSLKNVWFRYEKDAEDILKGLTFDVPEGRIFAILGGNGTGKTTMLRCISRILKPYRGKIEIKGKPLERYSAGELFKNNIAMLPQDPQSLFAKPTVREDLEEMLGSKRAAALEKRLEIEGFDNVPLDEEIAGVAELCGITHLLARNPYDLSGGEQQRAALAKVLLTHPQILLLDEPTKGMDNLFKKRFAGILKDITGRGMTVIMVSHDVEFCAMYADTAGMFFDGQLVSYSAPERFFSQNSFYTTAANRMARHIFPDAVTTENVVEKIRESKDKLG